MPDDRGPPPPETSQVFRDAPANPLDDAPPFLSWRGIYLIVIGVLAAQVVVYSVLTAIYR